MIDCCSALGLLPFANALDRLINAVDSVNDVEIVAIEHAVGRVLAQEVISPVNVPPQDNSAMDGYAFCSNDIKEGSTLTLVGKSFAGSPYLGDVNNGECVRIMTGAKIPEGCDTVEMQENVTVKGEQITFNYPVKPSAQVRYAGEDIAVDQVVFSQRHKITAVDIGLLASLGIATITVFRKLNVALISTGDELTLPGEHLVDGNIYESNRYVLKALLEKLTVNVIDFGIIKDDLSAIRHAFSQANEQADVVISSGGVSVGEADYTKDVLCELGQVDFWKIAMKPGKPFAFGKLSQSVFFGLPGNPVSALVTFHQLAVPGIEKMQGTLPAKKLLFKANLVTDLKKSPGRMDFQRGVLTVNDEGELQVQATGAQGSGILSSIAKANCYIVLAQEQGRCFKGEKVSVQLFDHLLS